METVIRDYADQGVQFVYVYKALAHPEVNGYVPPFTLAERLMHVQEAEKRLGSHALWIGDSMDNALKHAFGDAPNSEFVIDPEGKIVRKRLWSRPAELRADLEQLVGPVDDPTRVDEIEMPELSRTSEVAVGIVPRLRLPGRMRPVIISPIRVKEAEPFYVKLRAEAEESLLRGGDGNLYLGFYLDPLYKVHWNNRAKPLRYELEVPAGVTVEPAKGVGPEPEADADADPREFLVAVSVSESATRPTALKLTVWYFACDDAETFCVPVQQHYEIQLRPDPDGGSRRVPRG